MLVLNAPSNDITGKLLLGGSKSLSNRFLILGEILAMNTGLENLSGADDTKLLAQAIQSLHSKKKATLDVNHAGTAMRFLSAFLSIKEGEWTLTGSERLRERPIMELVNALRSLGANIHYLEKENFLPLLINGRKLEGGTVSIDAGISSQFISALLLIAPALSKGLVIQLKGTPVSAPYMDMTIELLKQFGIEISRTRGAIEVKPVSKIKSIQPLQVESDWSSASYFYSICALSKNAKITLGHFSQKSLQGDSVLPGIYDKLGVKTEFSRNEIKLSKKQRASSHFEFDFTACPDLAQTLAVTCAGLGMEARLKGLKTLRVKETDRILALSNELQKFGCSVESGNDFLNIGAGTIKPTQVPVKINTYKDHRMAMSFAPLALVSGSIEFDESKVVNKSNPSFWDDLVSLGFSVNLQT